jgi:hypothetical protein
MESYVNKHLTVFQVFCDSQDIWNLKFISIFRLKFTEISMKGSVGRLCYDLNKLLCGLGSKLGREKASFGLTAKGGPTVLELASLLVMFPDRDFD